ncbi:hypothetical protein C2W64_00141 [Brevibacillus laterosporus]|nr:hypothetical protein C2W64_00141 [Brevibacillus laterosporus]
MNTLLQKCVKIVLLQERHKDFTCFLSSLLLSKGGSHMFTLLISIFILAIGGVFFLFGPKRSS